MNRNSHTTRTNSLGLYTPEWFLLPCKLSGLPQNGFNQLIGRHNVNHPATRPQLHLGLTSDAEEKASAWFLAVFPQAYRPERAVTVHFGLVGVGPVLLPLFFLRNTQGKEKILLETSLNPYQADLQGLKLLRCMCTQASYQIHCRDLTTNDEDTFTVPNIHQDKYREAVKLLEAHPPWTATQFIQAQFHLARSWTTPEERYKNLQSPPAYPSSIDL